MEQNNTTVVVLQEGYRTLVGDGSGTIVSPALLLKLALARALVRRPRLLLLDDAEQFADAVGRNRWVCCCWPVSAAALHISTGKNGVGQYLVF